MRIPTATYRLQFHKDFGFANAKALIEYLHDLGISDVYASPIFKARAGSQHGYDVVDHSQIDPALGGADEFAKFSAALRTHGMGLILDIVPNHMGIGEPSNAWWLDVLENGPSSSYAAYFDIDWQPANPHLENKVLLPILEDQYGNVLEDGKLRLAYEDGALFIYYYETELPVAPRTYSSVLSHALDSLTEKLGKEDAHLLELQSILTAISHLPLRTETEPEKLAERRREKEIVKRRIAALYQANIEAREAINATIRRFNGTVGDPKSFDLLDGLLADQPYRLAFWRVAGEEINYRRFFDINELAAIRTEIPEVFQATHQLILRLVDEGKVTGLRVDHPDGLREPAAYFQLLQQSQNRQGVGNANLNGSASPPLYIVAEKVLSRGESLPVEWAACGTTGYDFLNQVNGLFVKRASRRALDRIYRDFTGMKDSYRDSVNSRKKMIMLVSLASEINALSHRLDDISERNRHYRDFTLISLTFAIREVIACLSVYRTYADGTKGEMSEQDRRYIDAAVAEAKRRNPRTARAIFDFLGDTLALRNLDRFDPQDRQAVIDFVMKFQQITGPVMAKGVEDTAFYVYNRLISLNEVGGDPEHFGISLEDFHRQNAARRRHWPHSMLTCTTHDTKRSEDVRARINALSEIPADWESALGRWSLMNVPRKTEVDGQLAPDRNDEYLLYQTLLGTWPDETLTHKEFDDYRERIAAYMQKAIKEAKVHTSWVNPNESYDRAVDDFVRKVLDSDTANDFITDFTCLHCRIAYAGMLNSISQTLLKITSPGVPDFYQGTELWDLSLVDPDNRRPVDFAKRKMLLEELKRRDENERPDLLMELLDHWGDGRVKLYLIYKTFNFRRKHEQLFREGSYLPLYASGKFRENICAFARRLNDQWVIAAAPRLLTRILPPAGSPLAAVRWEEEILRLPNGAPQSWRNTLTGENVPICKATDRRMGLPLQAIFKSFPVALIANEAIMQPGKEKPAKAHEIA
ncbi:MAG: malto-oligosyltrehalose synthase [Deltaproteobacteria bacterium]|nr:malto-oligosyltrehalose synthase [Deltaproteobacteria bacterium]